MSSCGRRSQHRQLNVEPLWSPAVATRGNRWQTARPLKRPRQAKTVAVGCDQLPESFHGKEGVDGSSPSEGLHKAPANRRFCVVCGKNARTQNGHISGTHDALSLLVDRLINGGRSRLPRSGSRRPRGAPPPPTRCCAGRLEVVLAEPVCDLLPDHRTLNVGGAEVNPAPDRRVDDLLERLREAVRTDAARSVRR
jgi:hypothetical protein